MSGDVEVCDPGTVDCPEPGHVLSSFIDPHPKPLDKMEYCPAWGIVPFICGGEIAVIEFGVDGPVAFPGGVEDAIAVYSGVATNLDAVSTFSRCAMGRMTGI